MTNSSDNPMDAVTGLMLERQRYEDWLAMLEAKRAVTAPHVFERVHGDYRSRLDAVTEQLKGRTSELKDAIAAHTARLKEAQTRERELTDERHEAELRAAVGEFTSQQWDDLSRRTDAEISRLAAERKAASEEIGRLNQILSMAGGPGESRQAGTPSAGGAKVDSGRAPTPAVSRPAQPTPAPTQNAPPATRGDTAAPRTNFDELAFLQSVTGQRDEAAARRSDPAAAPSPASRGPSGNSPAVPARQHDEATESPTAAPLGPSADEQQPSDRPLEQPFGRDTGPMSSILRDVPQEHVKTLKCAECGAMNYPTEWYCERCGAELAAM